MVYLNKDTYTRAANQVAAAAGNLGEGLARTGTSASAKDLLTVSQALESVARADSFMRGSGSVPGIKGYLDA